MVQCHYSSNWPFVNQVFFQSAAHIIGKLLNPQVVVDPLKLVLRYH